MKASAAAHQAAAAGQTGAGVGIAPPVTDYLATVVQSMRGGLKAGDLITVTAHGGQDQFGSGIMAGEPLPRIGQNEIVFLIRNQLDASKYTFVNPQGRFAVANNGTVAAVNREDQVSKQYDNSSLTTIDAAVRAAGSGSKP